MIDGGGGGRLGRSGLGRGVGSRSGGGGIGGRGRGGGAAGGGERNDPARPGSGSPKIGLDDGPFGEMRAAQVHEFEQPGLLQGRHDLVRVLQAGELGDDAVGRGALHNHFAYAQAVGTVLEDLPGGCQVIRADRGVGRQVGFQEHLQPAAQVEAQAYVSVAIDERLSVKRVGNVDLLAQIHPGGESH